MSDHQILSSHSFSGITHEVQSLVTSFSWPRTLVPRVYHSAMQLQPATDKTSEVPLGYFFAEYHTGWNRLYENMILTEIDCSTAHSISLFRPPNLARLFPLRERAWVPQRLPFVRPTNLRTTASGKRCGEKNKNLDMRLNMQAQSKQQHNACQLKPVPSFHSSTRTVTKTILPPALLSNVGTSETSSVDNSTVLLEHAPFRNVVWERELHLLLYSNLSVASQLLNRIWGASMRLVSHFFQWKSVILIRLVNECGVYLLYTHFI